jgi:CRISPR type IV-associated protein Csf3
MGYSPLRVRAHLRSGVVADKFLPLDGILYYQFFRDKYGHQIITTPGSSSVDGDVCLPIAVENEGSENWYYKCSWAQWSDDYEGQEHWNKRFDSALSDIVDFGKRRGKVIVEQGKFKAYHMPIFYRASRWIDWYMVGDVDGVNFLLSTLTNIGKKASQGWGRVYQWEVSEMEDDLSIFHNGRLMRGIPIDDVDKNFVLHHHVANYGIRPSYWLRENRRKLAVPA